MSTEPQTDSEKKFLDILERWEGIFPDGEHIEPNEREERLRRTLAWFSYEETNKVLDASFRVLIDFATVISDAQLGRIRPAWVSCMKDIVNEFTFVSNILNEAHKCKLH